MADEDDVAADDLADDAAVDDPAVDDAAADDPAADDVAVDDVPGQGATAGQGDAGGGPPADPVRARGGQGAPAAAFGASIVAAVALAVVYDRGGQTQAEGALLAVALGGIGVGLVLWAKRFMPEGPDVEPRGRIGSTEDDQRAFVKDFEAGGETFGRRNFLTKLLFGAVGALGVAALFPLRSLGPRPGRGLKSTPYRSGVRLVSDTGDPIRPDDPGVGGVITAFPEGHVGDETAQTLLIRLLPGQLTPQPGREDWTVNNVVAYSKVCTHAGCPVGLYQKDRGELLCPCHQSTFDVFDGATPVFGPATRPLPQLPLGIDDDGNIIATGDFSGPVGPGFWDIDK